MLPASIADSYQDCEILRVIADTSGITAYPETIRGQMFRCGKRVGSFTSTHCWGTSALDDGFEAVGFEVVARIRGGLRVGVGTNLNAKILVRAGGDDEGGKFLLLQGQGVSFALDGRDCVFRR